MEKYLGKRLDGRYEMRELIGIGGMAYVYKAYDAAADRTVAVKILRDEFLSNEEFTRRFRNESKAIAILNHPNIVKVLDVGFGERLQYIVMEYIDGITLKEYLDQRKDIRWKEAVHFTVQILRALQHAHDKGIVHRDIKPQNIMLLSDGTIKVTDFGIARLSRSEQLRATAEGDKAIGSVHYISPEQARGDITDEKADLYSVGVMLYEMLTGTLPFEADNAVSVAIMQMQSEPKLPHTINPEIPEGLEQITMKAMQKDSAKRYQSAAEMLCDIDEFKRNPSIKFEYTYFVDDTPTRYVDAITRVRGDSEGTFADADDEPDKKSKTSMVAILAGVAGGVALLAILVAGLFITGVFGGSSRSEITVDQFVGLAYPSEVEQQVNIQNYEIKVETGYTDKYPEGYVFKQEPAAGDTIKMKGVLTLFISKGSRLEAVPTVRPGENANTVRSRLADAGFKVTEVEESSLEFKQGFVIRTDPKPGEMVQHGSEVVVYISSGEPVADPIEMSNVIGMAANDARDKLVDDGFDINKIKMEYVNDVTAKDTVIRVSPDHTQKQLPDSTITLTVSSGFRDVTIDMPLPEDTNYMVDLQFIVDRNFNSELTDKYKKILPSYVGSLDFQVTETKENYRVLVRIGKSGAADGEFVNYAEYIVNGKEGTYTLNGGINYDWDVPVIATTTSTTETTTTTLTDTSTETTTTTTAADDGDEPDDE